MAELLDHVDLLWHGWFGSLLRIIDSQCVNASDTRYRGYLALDFNDWINRLLSASQSASAYGSKCRVPSIDGGKSLDKHGASR